MRFRPLLSRNSSSAQGEHEGAGAVADRLLEGELELGAGNDVDLAADGKAGRSSMVVHDDFGLRWNVVGHRTLSWEVLTEAAGRRECRGSPSVSARLLVRTNPSRELRYGARVSRAKECGQPRTAHRETRGLSPAYRLEARARIAFRSCQVATAVLGCAAVVSGVRLRANIAEHEESRCPTSSSAMPTMIENSVTFSAK